MKKLIIIIAVLVGMAVNTIKAQSKLTADVFASYFGGSGDEENIYIAVDKLGNVILAGHSYSENLPVEPTNMAHHHNVRADNPDAFITKFNPEMNKIIFSTYLGGSNYDEIKAVTLDSNGNIYVTGATNSNNFPVSPNALYKTFNGGFDIFITKLAPDGTIKYSTYLGGSSDEFPSCISMNDTSNIYLAGYTNSTNFPTQNSLYGHKGNSDVFLTVINLDSNKINFSSYLGGNDKDYSEDMKIDATGNIFVCGSTDSPDFPVKNAYKPSHGGRHDGFIAKINNMFQLAFSTFIGGSGDDGIYGIDVNNKNEVFFAGNSSESNLTCSANAFSSARGEIDVLIGKLNTTGDSLKYLSYFGGTNYDVARKIKYIGDDKIVIAGRTYSSNFPISSGANQGSVGNWDIFLSVLDIAQKSILYSTYYGGSNAESVFDLCVTNDSTIYLSGISNSSNFPVSDDAYTKTFQGVSDAIMARFKLKIYQPTSINTGIKSNKIYVYPNPTKGIVNFHFNNDPAQESVVEIYNLLGTQVFTKTFQNIPSATIDLTGNTDGIYIVKVIACGEYYEGKILKE